MVWRIFYWNALGPLVQIEHCLIWDVEWEIRIADVQPTVLQQLHDIVVSIWTKVSEECCRHRVEFMPQRIKAVLQAKGGPMYAYIHIK